MAKPELEFFDPLAEGSTVWQPVAADATGQLSELVLSRDAEGGAVTRLLRFAPGTDTSANGTVTHDVWEEIWIVEGTLHDLLLRKTFTAGMYACRPQACHTAPGAPTVAASCLRCGTATATGSASRGHRTSLSS
jgi:hypothetical protein